MLPTAKRERELMAEVPVNGKVLEWARQIRGLSLHDAAELLRISVTELGDFESGAKKPQVGILRQMAAKYRINFTALLMPEPLRRRKLPTDYRRRVGSARLSVDTYVAIEEVYEALEIFKDISATRKLPVRKPKLVRATLRDNPEELATQERRKFGVTLEIQHSWKHLYKARIEWRKKIEERGIFTYMLPLPTDELSGFSVFHDDFAAICVNDRESTEGAKIFTLLHEYCHLLLRRAGISDEKNGNSIERFCNQFAASCLIPQTQLAAVVNMILGDIDLPSDFSDRDVKRLSNYFLVSNRAMALRLEKTGLAPNGFYARRTLPWDLPAEKQPIKPNSEPNPLRIRYKQMGQLHTSTVLEAVKRNAINSVDAADLIGIRPQFFPKLEALLG
jgi:Zn-dependent peptidase ImmA (M78 family)